MVSTVSPDTGTTTYVYDEAGNLFTKTDVNGVTVTYAYDPLNRLTSVNFSAHGDQPTYNTTYFYDQRTNGKGPLTDIFDLVQTTVFNYNTRGRLEEKNVTIGANVFTLSQDLTPGGRVSHMEYPDGRTVDFERVGCACRATKVSTTYQGITKVIADQLSYRPFGETKGMNVGNGGAVNNSFDLDGRMTAANPGSTLARTFTYDALGHLKTLTIPEAAPLYLRQLYERSYEYDPLNRLTRVVGPFWRDTTFTYDDVGNRLTKNANGQIESYGYVSGSNQLSQITAGTSTSFSYDANGNIVGIGTRTLVWNQDNRLARVQDGANVLGQYGYNAFGQRVVKTAGGVTTYYLYDFQGNLMGEADASGNIQTEYLYRGLIRLAMANQGTGALYFFHNDQFGTPQIMTNENNTVVWEGTYEPFGLADINPHSTITNNFRFQGQFYDSETGYHYNHHRYYDPKTGRYLTPDPIGLTAGINPYVYTLNDPINIADPLGLFTEVIIWQPVGWGTSSFGHVSLNINGTSYSFAPGGMDIRAIEQFQNRNAFREAIGLELDLSPCEEQKLDNYLNSYNAPYFWPVITCISPIQSGLINVLGYNIQSNIIPTSMIDSLSNARLISWVNFYSPSNPGVGSNSPWARGLW